LSCMTSPTPRALRVRREGGRKGRRGSPLRTGRSGEDLGSLLMFQVSAFSPHHSLLH
jgi:hypothetical protein